MNSSCSGGIDQDDCDLKPARTNGSQDHQKKSITKMEWWSSSMCRL
jgi:hypothetical protein